MEEHLIPLAESSLISFGVSHSHGSIEAYQLSGSGPVLETESQDIFLYRVWCMFRCAMKGMNTIQYWGMTTRAFWSDEANNFYDL